MTTRQYLEILCNDVLPDITGSCGICSGMDVRKSQFTEHRIYCTPLQRYLRSDSTLIEVDLLTGFQNRNKYGETLVAIQKHPPKKLGILFVNLNGLRKVWKLLQEWKHFNKTIPISVNLNRVTLMEHGIVQTITDIVDEYHVSHDLIVIEITERIGLVENEVASTLVDEFKAKSFCLSLDKGIIILDLFLMTSFLKNMQNEMNERTQKGVN